MSFLPTHRTSREDAFPSRPSDFIGRVYLRREDPAVCIHRNPWEDAAIRIHWNTWENAFLSHPSDFMGGCPSLHPANFIARAVIRIHQISCVELPSTSNLGGGCNLSRPSGFTRLYCPWLPSDFIERNRRTYVSDFMRGCRPPHPSDFNEGFCPSYLSNFMGGFCPSRQTDSAGS